MAAQDNRLGDAKRAADEAADIARHGLLVIAAKRTRRIAGTAIVGRDHAKTLGGEQRHQLPPFVPGLREAVQQDQDAVAFAGCHIMQPHARLDLGGAVHK